MTTPDITVNLTRYSLNHVVAHDKTLWQPPLKWTSAHLSVLGIHPRRRRLRQPLCRDIHRDIHPTTTNSGVLSEEDGDSSDTDHERSHEGGRERGKGGEGDDQFYNAVIPNLTSARLGQFIASFSGGGLYETRACQLIRLLLGTPPRPIARRDTNKDHERRDDGVPGRRFSFRWLTPQLIVGPRTYKLHFLFHLILDATLVLPYVDSSCVLRPRFRVRRRRDLTRPFEPFIAAVLISLAQSSVSLENADAKKSQSNIKAAANRVSLDNTAESATDGVITALLHLLVVYDLSLAQYPAMADHLTSVASTAAPRKRHLPSSSSWVADELATFHVIVNDSDSRVLAYLKQSTAPCDDLFRNPDIAPLLQPTPDLRRFSLLDQPTANPNPITVEHADIVDSTPMQVGSSNPAQESSQISFHNDAFVAENHNPMARDEATGELLTSFVRLILHSIPHEDWALNNRLECRAALATEATMTGGHVIQAEDDGGLLLRRRIASVGDDGRPTYYAPSQPADCYHAIFKKTGFQTNDGRPTFPNNCFGQMTAAALAGRLIRSSINSESHVLIIAVARQFVCFLDFDITDDYLEDIQSETPDLTLPVSYTDWLDLNDPKDRRDAIENIARLAQLSG
ncbi:hypothetical protein NPX13_g9080 [Xylaria arbuscula]|uniref:Uncharacterized protein n=1 Tax=Xylaria arbuscula TaxID=114810 RepID=A0A9W8TI08_9PEZI|nr:hypothetical protein NPX13_g9080 [Xylaria arbuscula]